MHGCFPGVLGFNTLYSRNDTLFVVKVLFSVQNFVALFVGLLRLKLSYSILLSYSRWIHLDQMDS